MNTKIMDGKLIASVHWAKDDGDERIVASDEIGLHMSATYHGDRDEFWIVQSDAKGNEVARHNTRYVESFVWVEPIDPHPTGDSEL